MDNVHIGPLLTLLTLFFVCVLHMYTSFANAFKGIAESYTFSIARSYILHCEKSYISRAILCQKRVPHRVVLINEEERRKMRFWEKDATLGGCRLRQNNSISFLKLEVKPFICIISRYLLCVFISPFRMRNGGSQDSGRKMQTAAAAGSDKGEERH